MVGYCTSVDTIALGDDRGGASHIAVDATEEEVFCWRTLRRRRRKGALSNPGGSGQPKEASGVPVPVSFLQ
jgi:hypothetical protein